MLQVSGAQIKLFREEGGGRSIGPRHDDYPPRRLAGDVLRFRLNALGV
jgi:hypothetical protein